MRKPQISLLAMITLLFVTFTAGYFLGMNRPQAQLTVSVAKEMTVRPQETVHTERKPEEQQQTHFPIFLNSADKDDLMALPGVGELLAQRILDYRQTHGSFRSAEELLNVEGIGEKRLAEILDLIVIGG